MPWKSRLPRISAELGIVLDAVAAEGAEQIAQAAKARVPVETGRLREAIHVEAEGPGEFYVVAGDTEAFYGHIVEHGGAHTPPRPFLIPAGEERAPVIIKTARKVLKGL